MAGTRHKAEWLNDVGSDVESIIYQQEHPEEPNFYTRHGNEVGAYLRFLIDYYNCLPNVSSPSLSVQYSVYAAQASPLCRIQPCNALYPMLEAGTTFSEGGSLTRVGAWYILWADARWWCKVMTGAIPWSSVVVHFCSMLRIADVYCPLSGSSGQSGQRDRKPSTSNFLSAESCRQNCRYLHLISLVRSLHMTQCAMLETRAAISSHQSCRSPLLCMGMKMRVGIASTCAIPSGLCSGTWFLATQVSIKLY